MPRIARSAASRREFMKTASLAAAGAAVVPGPRLLGRTVSRSPNDTIGVGVIGTGGMGSAHARSLVSLNQGKKENLRIVALSDVCKPRLDACAGGIDEAQGGDPVGRHRDYHDLLARKDVDVVWVASPEHWHAQMTIDAMAAGKDVYVEKPMTLDLPDAIRLRDAARKSKQIVEVGTQYVTDSKYHTARKWMAEGRIGKPCSSETGYCRNSKTGEWNYYHIDPKVVPGPNLDWEAWCGPLGVQPFDPKVYARWRRYRRYSTGIVGDLLVHQMTPLMWALDQGFATRVVAAGGHYVDQDMENFDQVNLTLQFEKGHTMSVWGSTCNANGPAPLIRGHKANLQLSGNNCRLVPENIFAEDIDGEDFKGQGSSHDGLRLDFLQAARTRGAVQSPVELGFQVMVAVDLAARSMWEGKAYSYDPATDDFTCI